MRIVLLLAFAVILSGCSEEITQTQAKSRAQNAFKEMAQELKTELGRALAEGGPREALEVCSLKAPELARKLSNRHGFSLGRSSHRLRNANNAPRAQVESYLARYSQRPTKEAPVEVVEGQESWVVVAPIPTAPVCLTCHGQVEQLSEELKAGLQEFYPADRATGFEVGDLRGVFWAEIPR